MIEPPAKPESTLKILTNYQNSWPFPCFLRRRLPRYPEEWKTEWHMLGIILVVILVLALFAALLWCTAKMVAQPRMGLRPDGRPLGWFSASWSFCWFLAGFDRQAGQRRAGRRCTLLSESRGDRFRFIRIAR